MNFTSAAIRYNRITAFLVLLVVVGGFISYRSASRAEDPGFPVRTAMVQTFFPGASPERVEQLVTDKLEEEVMEMPELDFVNSMSKTGVSTLFVNIKESHKEHELRAIWDSLRRKIEAAEPNLPGGVIGPFVNDEFGDVFGIVIGLTGDGYTRAELKEVADEVREELLRMSDVAKVDIYGAVEERIFIEIRNEQVAELGVSPAQLRQLLESQNIVIPGGEIRSGPERYALEPSGNFESVEEIGKTVMQLPGRKEVFRLSDVAKITRGYVEPAPREFRSSGNSGLGLALSMTKGGDIVQLGEDVRVKIRALEHRYPLGIEFDVLIYQPKDVLRLVDNFVENLLQAVGIVMLAMILFLGLRTGLIVASLIPSAIAAAFLIMGFFDIGVNQLSLASLIIALGLLVDNAVVMAESTLVQMTEGKSRFDAAVDSAKELGLPLLISSLTTCAAFLPIFLAESSTGEYTADLFRVVSITLLSSWVLSMSLTPLLCASFLKASPQKEGGLGAKLYGTYRPGVGFALKHRGLFMGAMVAIFVVGVQGFGYIPNIFFPPSDNPSFIVDLELPAGTAIETTKETTTKIEEFLEEELRVDEDDESASGVTHWATYVGESGPRFYLSYVPDPPSPETAVLVVSATDRDAANKSVERLREFISEKLPDARATVEPRSLGPPADAPVAFEISGPDQDTVFSLVDGLRAKMLAIPGTTNVRDDWGQRVKKLKVKIDADRVLQAGLTNQDVAVSLQTALSGFEVTSYREGDDTIPVVLRRSEADRDDLDKLETLAVSPLGGGPAVPLKAVADVNVVWEPSVIRRRNRQQSVSVKANLDPGFTSASVNAQVIPFLKGEEKGWDLGYRWRMGGEMEQAEKGNESINVKMPIGMLIIVMLLVAQFNSVRRASIILLTIPLSLVGVAGGLLVFKSYFGFMTLLGVYALFGIVINNAIVLIDRIDLEIEAAPDDRVGAIINACQRRLRPILLTTFTTVLGLVPLWLGGGPMWEPMAIAIIFGLLFSTVLTLGVVPVLYSLFFRVKSAAQPSK